MTYKQNKNNHYAIDDSCVVLQEQWLITSASSEYPILRTYEVKPCIAIAVFYQHPSDQSLNKAALIHMDDITQRDGLEFVLNSFYIQDEILPKQLQVTLIGGWQTNPSSKAMGEFAFNYFTKAGCQVNQDRLFAAPIGEQHVDQKLQTHITFSFVSIDSRSGQITTSDDLNKVILTKELYTLYKNILSRIDYHIDQQDHIPLSGVPLFFNCDCFNNDSFLSECLEYKETYSHYTPPSKYYNNDASMSLVDKCVWQEDYLKYLNTNPLNSLAFPPCE